MTTLRFADQVAARLEEVFRANLAGNIATIATETGEALGAIATFITGERAVTPAETYPAMWIFVQGGEAESDAERLQYALPYGVWRHSVDLGIAVVHPTDASALREQLYRYTQAVIKTIRDLDGTDPEFIRARVVAYSLQDVIEFARETQQRQDVVIHLEVTRAD